MKIVYLWKNGQQVIVFQNDEGEYNYPTEKWTEQQPPEGIYAPFYYDGQKWVGQSKEDFEKSLPPEEPEVDEKDAVIAGLTATVAEMSQELSDLQDGFAKMAEEHANMKLGAE